MSEQVLMRFRLKADGKLYEMVGSKKHRPCHECVANHDAVLCEDKLPMCHNEAKPGVGMSKHFRRVEG